MSRHHRSSSICGGALIARATTILALCAIVSTAIFLPVAMAVDRTKFRTCQQTSFCRRHRHGKSKRLYDYKLVSESVQLHNVKDAVANAAASSAAVASEKRGLLSKFLGGYSSSETEQLEDPFVRGPPAIFTAKLVNVAPLTSTKLTAQTYGDGCDLSKLSFEEELQLSVHLHEDGVARIRIKEVMEEDSSVRSTPRWTSDELVLNEDEMVAVEEVQAISTNPAIQEKFDESESNNKMPTVEVKNSVSSLIKRANVDSASNNDDNFIVLTYGSNEEQWKLMIQIQPFAVYMFRGNEEDGPPIIAAGTNGLTHFEVRRSKECSTTTTSTVNQIEDKTIMNDVAADTNEDVDRHGGKEVVGYWEDGLAIYADGSREERKEVAVEEDEVDKGEGREERRLEEEEFDTKDMWEEKFGDHIDSKPYGPMSVGMELTFPSSTHLFGLPEHASSTQLKTTAGMDGHHYYKEPYRLYNLDVFEYELDETMALYGHIPLVVSQSVKTGTAGAFWFNPTETFVDIEETPQAGGDMDSRTHFMSESGIVDLFLLPGSDPASLYGQYARLTGRMQLPPIFSLGYHQCRWNYRDEADVYFVNSKFEELDYPYDVLWLDIEHTDGKRYFTWDDKTFPNPIEMQNKLGATGRRMVTIIDPHIKRDNQYYIHKEATARGLYVKDKSGNKDYDGWCWPGSSSYLDFTVEKVRNWWADQFNYDKYKGSTPTLFTWNDMNEPSVFNGPEVSMQKDLLNLNNVEHREWHNLYGMLFQRSTAEGLTQRNEGANVRPFVLSRSFFAGSQRYGAIWTGDNAAEWSHLQIASPMLLGLNVAALSFVGADVGGFFGNCDAELITRWMQAAAYQPFFRGHAHHDSKRREPWMFGDETMVRLRHAAMARYALLPFWYTIFWQAGVSGMPVMRTMWMQYPDIPELYSIDDQYLIGSDLLVKPVTSAGATTSHVLFPLADCWYDVDTMQRVELAGAPGSYVAKTVESGIDKIPVYQRGGSIIPRKLRLRRSSYLMINDPYTIYIALNNELKAEGTLYMDDETTFDHEKRDDYGVATFSSDLSSSIIVQNTVTLGNKSALQESKEERMIERIVLMGIATEPKQITLTTLSSATAIPMEFHYDEESKILVIRKPGVSALDQWTMNLTP